MMEVGRRKGRMYVRPWAEAYPTHSSSHWQSSVPIAYAQLVRKPLLQPSVSRDSVFSRRRRDKSNHSPHKPPFKRPPTRLQPTRSLSISFPHFTSTPNESSPDQSSTGMQTDRSDYPPVRPSLKLPVLYLHFYPGKPRGLNYK